MVLESKGGMSMVLSNWIVKAGYKSPKWDINQVTN